MRNAKIKKYTIEKFIDHCSEIHSNKYDYSKVELTLNSNPVTIICPKHGEFSQVARNHYNGCGCYNCYNDSRGKKRMFTKEQIVKRATDIWGDRFDYSEMDYTGILDRHEIKCNLCGEKFTQDLNNHINYKKNGCPNCKENRGWSRSQWIDFCNRSKFCNPLVYVVRLFNDKESFIKIGMTNATIGSRMKRIRDYEYEVIKEIKGSPLFVYDKEIELHRKFVKFRQKPLISFKGEWECYSLDILPLIDQI